MPQSATSAPVAAPRSPSLTEPRALIPRLVLGTFVVVPFLALLAAVPVAITTGWVTPLDLILMVLLYTVGVHGITIGYHRLFTHRSFTARRGLRVGLAVAGSLAVEGRLIDWVADHRRHHAYSDLPGDPHSPWGYGDSAWGITKGLWHAHVGWLFTDLGTDTHRFAPDLHADRDTARVSAAWPALAALSLAAVPLLVWAITWDPMAALRAFFWTSLVRVALVHHLTWSINSICHVFGTRPFRTRDRSGNVGWLAVVSAGESWHNLHHAEPTSARHGVLPRQIDTSARIIRWFEQWGWASNVRWMTPERIEAKRVPLPEEDATTAPTATTASDVGPAA